MCVFNLRDVNKYYGSLKNKWKTLSMISFPNTLPKAPGKTNLFADYDNNKDSKVVSKEEWLDYLGNMFNRSWSEEMVVALSFCSLS